LGNFSTRTRLQLNGTKAPATKLNLSLAPPPFGAQRCGGSKSRGTIEPAGKSARIPYCFGFAGQSDEHRLRHILRKQRFAHEAEGSGINQIHVPRHEFSKSGFGLIFRVLAQ
jgi:hypothetical protein